RTVAAATNRTGNGYDFVFNARRKHADTPPQENEGPPPTVVRFPRAASAWDAAADQARQVHVACAVPDPSGPTKLWYLRSDVALATWSEEVEVPTVDEPVTIGGIERGPRIAVNGSSIVIAWQSKYRIACRYSPDNGKTWQGVRVRDGDATGGIDMVAMA